MVCRGWLMVKPPVDAVGDAVSVGGSCSICAGERNSGQSCISALHGPCIWGALIFSVRGWIERICVEWLSPKASLRRAAVPSGDFESGDCCP